MADLMKFDQVKVEMIVALYEAAHTGRITSWFEIETATGLLADKVNSLVAEQAIKELHKDGYLQQIASPLKFQITPELIRAAEKIVSEDNSDLSDESSKAKEDEAWEPLPIERESPEYTEAVSRSEDALKAIEGDNGFADSEPDERNHIVYSIGAGVNALKEGLITKQQVFSLLLTPLRRVVEKLKEGVTVEAARMAAHAIAEWLKGLI